MSRIETLRSLGIEPEAVPTHNTDNPHPLKSNTIENPQIVSMHWFLKPRR
jgi:hypothetical protein